GGLAWRDAPGGRPRLTATIGAPASLAGVLSRGLRGWGWEVCGGVGLGAGDGGNGEEQGQRGPAQGAVGPGAVAVVALAELVEEDGVGEVDGGGDGDDRELHDQPGAVGEAGHEDDAGEGVAQRRGRCKAGPGAGGGG